MLSTTTFLLSKTLLLSQFPPPLQPMLSTTTFLLSKTFFLSKFSPPLQPMLSTTFLLSKTFLLSQFSPPSAAHAFNYNIPFIKNIPFITISPPSAAHAFNYNIPFIKNILFIKIFPPSAAHAFNYIPFIKNIPFITIFPPLCSPCFQLQHSFYQKHYFYHNFPSLCSPQHSRHTFAFVRPYLTSFYQNFPPPSAAHAFNYNIPFIKNIPFITIFPPPLCSPQHSRHTFAFVRPYLTFFYQNFTPPLQPMLSTTFLLSKTFLLSQFSPPSAAHAFNYNIPFIKNIPFITNFHPLCSPQHSRHTFAFVRPYLTSFYQNFSPPLQPMLSTTFLLSKTFLLSQFSPPLCSPQHSRHTFAFVRPYLTSFYQNFTPPLQPMLSTTFLLSKTFLLSQFSPPSAAHAFNYIPFIKNIPFITIYPRPLQPMLSTTTFLLSKTLLLSQFSPPSTAHNIADTHLPLCDPTWLPFIKIFPPLCNPCFQLQHSFYQKHSFYHNFPPPLQPTTLPTHICLCATLPDFLLSKFSPPSATHAFNYNIPFIKNIPFITIFPPSAAHNIADTHLPLCDPTWLPFIKISPPSAAHAFNYIPFIKNIPFIAIFPPLCSPCFQLQHSFYQKHSFYQNFPPLCSPCFQLHSFYQKHSFYRNFPPPLQPMLSTTFLLSKTFLLSQFSPPSAAHAFNYNIPFIKNITFITISPPSAAHNIADTHLPLCDPTWLPFIKIFPPLCSPCFQLQHSFYQKHSFYHNFPPPSAAHNIADTHLPLCDPTWLPFIKIFPPLCSPCFQLQHSFYQKHSFYHNFPSPLCSPQHSRHTFAFVRPYLTFFYRNFTPPLQPMLSTTFLLSKTFLLSQFSPPSAAHAFNYIPFIKNIPFITIYPPPLQPMLSTTTFLLSKTLLLSQFSPPSTAHNIADTHLPLCDPTWLPFIKIFPPLCSPCFQLQHSFYQKHSFYHNFPPPLQPTT